MVLRVQNTKVVKTEPLFNVLIKQRKNIKKKQTVSLLQAIWDNG